MKAKRFKSAGFEVRNFLLAAAAMAVVAVAGLAQVARADVPITPSDVTVKGDTFTLNVYGVIDLMYMNQSNGSPQSPTVPGGMQTFNFYTNKGPVQAIAGNGLEPSRLGFTAEDKLSDDLSAIFHIATFFNPFDGLIPNGPLSVQQNNGQTVHPISGGDSALAGQMWMISYAGISSKTLGTLTYGRQGTVNNDTLFFYDPMSRSGALSYVGFFGSLAGAGRTEDAILDSSIKYKVNIGNFRVALMDQPMGSYGYGYAEQAAVGADFGGLSIDVSYSYVADAIGITSTPATGGSTATNPAGTCPAGAAQSACPVAAKVTNDESTLIGLRYKMASTTLYAAYEQLAIYKPTDPIAGPTITIGGVPFVANYTFYGAVNCGKFGQASNCNAGANGTFQQTVYWVGVKQAVTDKLDVTGALYESWHNAFAASGTLKGCSKATSGLCSGYYDTQSVLADYKFDKHFDAYFGVQNDYQTGGFAAPISTNPKNNVQVANNNTLEMIGTRFKW